MTTIAHHVASRSVLYFLYLRLLVEFRRHMLAQRLRADMGRERTAEWPVAVLS